MEIFKNYFSVKILKKYDNKRNLFLINRQALIFHQRPILINKKEEIRHHKNFRHSLKIENLLSPFYVSCNINDVGI